ncbi:MAG: FtsW/RodA/SpoVE family cell cycle protein [Oscillospiraceae bacterium]|nr:FtsW/RodA/SpoVE family cell cycle protein [Oscillospiraceae bacterium]
MAAFRRSFMEFWRYIRSHTSDFRHRADIFLLAISCVCTVFGLILISSATKALPGKTYVPVQIFAFVLGLALYYVFTVLDVDIIADKWIALLIFETFIMALLIPFGVSGDTGNKGWLRFFGIGIQPSEIAKVVFIVLMARHMTYLKEYKDINSVLSMIQLVVHFGYTFVLIMYTSEDLGSAVVFAAIFVVMMIVAGVKLYWFLIGGAAVALAIPVLWNSFLDEYQRQRIRAPYDPTVDPTGWGITWQTTRSQLAMKSGQLTGVGLGNGTQTQNNWLTGKHTDFIFSMAGEELGMLACLLIMLLLTIIIIRCVMVGLRSNNTMSMLVCMGVAASIFFQMLVNTGMCIGITPVIGITLPFFSYGGSSLMSTFAAVGLVSGVKYRPTPQQFHRY